MRAIADISLNAEVMVQEGFTTAGGLTTPDENGSTPDDANGATPGPDDANPSSARPSSVSPPMEKSVVGRETKSDLKDGEILEQDPPGSDEYAPEEMRMMADESLEEDPVSEEQGMEEMMDPAAPPAAGPATDGEKNEENSDEMYNDEQILLIIHLVGVLLVLLSDEMYDPGR